MIQNIEIPFSPTLILPEIPCTVSWIRVSFSGVTAPCKLFLNDECVLEMENYFRTYTLELQPHQYYKTLTFQFENLQSFTKNRSMRWQTPMDENGFSYTNGYRYPYVRQPAYACGWDWCYPMVPLERIEKILFSFQSQTPIFCHEKNETSDLECTDFQLHVPYIISEQFDHVTVSPDVSFLNLSADPIEVEITFENESKSIIYDASGTINPITFSLKNPKLWFPNGMGNPALYSIFVTLKNTRTHISKRFSQSIGFKKITLKQTPFLNFEVNGIPCPMRGANFIPTHFHGHVRDDEKTTQLIQLAKEANFNMLRVWGGGSYADEHFYCLCDQLGILVWQDFPFACNLYPEHEILKKEIEQEVSQQLKRIRQHVSLSVLCGNNEVHSAYYEWLSDAKIPYFHGQFYFHTLLPQACEKWTPQVPYWAGSPFSSQFQNQPNSVYDGDRHAWQCFFGDEEAKNNFRVLADEHNMFISEVGFIAPPHYDSIPENMRTFDALDRASNYGIPIARLKTYIRQLYPIDDEHLTLEDFCELGQIAQAEMWKYVLDIWIKRSFYGILLWHFNDISVACSWGLIDGNMKPRKAYYVVKKVFSQKTKG